MSIETFTNRYVEPCVVAAVDRGAITNAEGWTAIAPPGALPLLTVGASYGLEMQGGPFGLITGWHVGGKWYNHKTDQDLERERAEARAERERSDRERLAAHRSEWVGREEMLPGWLKERIHVFHERGGEKFELEGWGYELVICELAALYAESGGADDDAINAYANEHGTSGNQHDCAKALARHHAAGASLAGTIAGLSPITGNAFYEPDSPVGGTQ